jgi:hypothetical protein
MTQIILKNQIERKKLETLLFLLKSWEIDAEVNNTDITQSKSKSNHELFSKTRGMWKNREIDARQLRREAWNGDTILKK